jgi:hypothetical protein
VIFKRKEMKGMNEKKEKAPKVGKIVPVNLFFGAKEFSSRMVTDSCDECCGPYAQCKTSC